MAYDGWMEHNDVEIINVARTAALAPEMGLDSVRVRPAKVAWLSSTLGASDYDDITEAPWYDAGVPASAEFAGILPLAVQGLDDSTLESATTEYTSDGGNSGHPRNTTLSIVFNVVLVGTTERGVEYGKRWMDRTLRGGGGARRFCTGSDLTYLRYGAQGAPKAHRRDVSLSRGSSVTRKHATQCAVTWTVTFTMTAADPYEYGEEQPMMADLGGTVTGPAVDSSGSVDMTHLTCPEYDYSPIFDPLYPAMVESPQAPDFYPDGWTLTSGLPFTRRWVRLDPVEPSGLLNVPLLTLTAGAVEARMVRLSIWPGDVPADSQCDPLFSVVVTYLPPTQQFVIDGEQKAAYLWDGVSDAVRRTDSLIYGPNAKPVEWAAFNDHGGLLVALDQFGAGGVRASLALVPKSD